MKEGEVVDHVWCFLDGVVRLSMTLWGSEGVVGPPDLEVPVSSVDCVMRYVFEGGFEEEMGLTLLKHKRVSQAHGGPYPPIHLLTTQEEGGFILPFTVEHTEAQRVYEAWGPKPHS